MVKTYIPPLKFTIDYINSKPRDLKSPKIHDEIQIPKSRCIHFNMFNTIEEDNYESFNFLNEIIREKILFYSVEKLHKPRGKLRITNKKLMSYNQDLRKKFSKAKILLDSDKVTITNRDLMVYNYKTIYVNNVYQVQPMLNYYKTINTLETLIHSINNSGDFLYNMVLFNIPVLFPSISKLTTDSKKEMNVTLAKRYPDMDSILLLELWNMMYADRDSVFKKIDSEKLQSIYFIFTNNNKYTVYKLTDLLSLSKELKVDGRYPGKSNLEASKIMMATLQLFKVKTTLSEEALKGMDEINIEDVDITSMSDKELDQFLKDMGMDTDEEIEDEEEEETPNIISEIAPKNNFKKEIKTIDDVKENLTKEIDTSILKKTISKAEATRVLETLDAQMDKTFEINGKESKLKEILSYDNIDITNRAIDLPSNITVLDKEMLSNLNDNLDKKYMKDLYYKDLFNSIYSIQNGKVAVLDHSIAKKKSFMGEVEEHSITIKPIDGGAPTTIKQILPVIDPETGTYKMSSNEYILRYQRIDLPIRKTSPTEVLLSSYAGKLFIEKNVLQTNNPSIWISKKLATDDRFSNIIMKRNSPFDLDLMKDYTMFGNVLNRFTFDGILFTFDYINRLSTLGDLDLVDYVKKVEKDNDLTFIGVKNNTRYYIAKDRTIVTESGKEVKTISEDIYSFLSIDTTNMPTEFAVIKILNKVIPLGVILLFYIGLDSLLDKLKISKRYYTKEDKYKLLPNEYAIELDGGKLVFDRKDAQAMIILSGIPKDISRGLKLEDLSDKESLSTIFNIMQLSIAHSTHITSIEDTFIDNITRDKLKAMKEPIDIHNLLIRAAELLVDDNYKNPNNITDNAIVRYERVPGMMYKVLSTAVKTYNTKNVLSKAKITVDPYAVWKMMGDDSTSMLVTNNNPIDTIKQRDNVTYLGEFGRSKITMTIPSRAMTPEEIGIISEASPDSGDSGINVYLTHSANITNLRGMVTPIDMKDHTINKALSTANILNPFIVNDDSKRANFASIQASHIIPMKHMQPNRVWTGAESTIAHKVGKPFVYTAPHYGKVEKVTKDKINITYSKPNVNDIILLEFDDNSNVRDVYRALLAKGYNITTDSKAEYKYRVYVGNPKNKDKNTIYIMDTRFIASGLKDIPKKKTEEYKKTYSLRAWASKIEGNQSIKHTMTTVLRDGDIVEPDDVIIYDESFFEPNIFDKKSIVVKMGATYRVAFLEKKTTYEDSMEINGNILDITGESKYKILSKVVDVNSHITNVLKEGSKVKYGDKLMTIIDSTLLLDNNLSEKSKLILSEASDSSPKANANGVIDRIDVIYNCELEDMDSSIRELADISNKRFKDEQGTDGRVTSEYSISGVPLGVNQIELKYFISYDADTKIGDKFAVSHQLKSTIGAILEDIQTEDGERIDYTFSNKSVLARITNSGYTLGIIGNMMKEITKRAVIAYRK